MDLPELPLAPVKFVLPSVNVALPNDPSIEFRVAKLLVQVSSLHL